MPPTMWPVATVIRPIFPLRSNIISSWPCFRSKNASAARSFESRDIVRRSNGRRLRLFGNPFDQPREHTPSADLIERGHTSLPHIKNRLAPANGASHLLDKARDDLDRVSNGPRQR